jgi:cell division protein FtsA
MADYIVAIDLGTSHITGIVGEKKADGIFSIIAYETVDADNCIHRGFIYNSDNTATQVSNLLKKLETHLKGEYIDKVYIGVGGQSLRTIDHVEAMDIADGATVTEADIAALEEQCRKFKPNIGDVLGMATPVYYLDGRKDTEADGVLCKRFEAHYKLVVGRSMIRYSITNSIEAIQDKELAGIVVAPLALADAVLSSKDKELGCALVDFGAGVTSVSVYHDGDLKHLCVIPFGGKLITRDLTILQLTEADAEKYKKERGSATLQNEDENESIVIEMESADREIKLSDVNAIIEGRTKEIVENVYARICDVIELRRLGAGIVLAGCAAELANLPEVLKAKCGVKVRFSTIQKGLVDDSDELLGNPLYMMAISLMLKGTEPCVSSRSTTQEDDIGHVEDDGNEITVTKKEKKKEKPPKKLPVEKEKTQGKGLKERIKGIFVTNLFDEE